MNTGLVSIIIPVYNASNYIFDTLDSVLSQSYENIEVILFHDYSYITYSILPDVIKYLEDNNYIILPLFYESIMVNK